MLLALRLLTTCPIGNLSMPIRLPARATVHLLLYHNLRSFRRFGSCVVHRTGTTTGHHFIFVMNISNHVYYFGPTYQA